MLTQPTLCSAEDVLNSPSLDICKQRGPCLYPASESAEKVMGQKVPDVLKQNFLGDWSGGVFLIPQIHKIS